MVGFFFFFFFFINLFIYFWLCWVFVSVRGLSLVVASGGHSSSQCAGLSLSWPLSLRSTGSRRAGSAVVAHGPSCSAACGIFPDQGSNPCPLHWQADSQPLRHQGSPTSGKFLKEQFWASLVAQRLSTYQCRGYGFRPWSGNIPHATKQLSLWATATEGCVPRAHAPQQEKPPQWEACAPQQAAPARCN